LRLAELELIDRERRMVERRIRAAHFSAVKSFDTFDFAAIPSLNKPLVLELARCEYLVARENVIALGNSGTGKTHVCLALGLAACQRGIPVAFFTAAGLVHQLMEARDERRLLKLQAQLAAVKLLIVDELGYVPLSQTGADILFEIFSQRHERSSTIVTSNLPFGEWTSVCGNQRLTGALLDRLTHHVHILELRARATGSSNRRPGGGVRPNPLRKPPRPPIPKPPKSSAPHENRVLPGYETPAISAGADAARLARCPRRKLAWFCSAPLAGFWSAVDSRPRSTEKAPSGVLPIVPKELLYIPYMRLLLSGGSG
jgi:DNA replication protein DnaC